jgi:hypothetical protein
MKGYLLVGALWVFKSLSLQAETIGFDGLSAGPQLPSNWKTGVTGKGNAKWAIQKDLTAPSQPNALKQSGEADFPWAIKEDVKLLNGSVEVKFKPISGSEDQAGGLVWRFKNGNNYYVARANALENNVSLYYVENGKRKTLKYVDAPVPLNQWHVLRAEFAGNQIKVLLNGKKYIDLKDDHISAPGAVGLWTKADSMTAFDDFTYQGT